MKKAIWILLHSFTNLAKQNQFNSAFSCLLLISGLSLVTLQQAKSDEIFLKCTGKYEINRGPLIMPDWETSYLKINLNGLISTVEDKGTKIKGRTSINGNSYRITHRDNRNNIKNVYKINGTHGTYVVEYPHINKILIGTCKKSRG